MKHDFYSNFKGSVTSGDVEFSLDLWVNEVSDLIVTQTQKVVDLLTKVGISAKTADPDEALVDKILDNVGKNDKLNRGISFLIGENNDLIKKNSQEWRDSIDKIAAAYEPIMKNISDNGSFRASVKTDLMQHIKSKAENSKTNNRIVFKAQTPEQIKKRNRKIFWWVMGGIAALAITGACVYYYKKNKVAPGLPAPAGADGLVPTTPQVPAQPVATAAPIPTAPVATAPITPPAAVAPPPASVQTVNVAPAAPVAAVPTR